MNKGTLLAFFIMDVLFVLMNGCFYFFVSSKLISLIAAIVCFAGAIFFLVQYLKK